MALPRAEDAPSVWDARRDPGVAEPGGSGPRAQKSGVGGHGEPPHTGQGGMEAPPIPAKGAGLEGCSQGNPAGTRQGARVGTLPCPASLGGQGGKTGKENPRCESGTERGWKSKPEENVSVFNPQAGRGAMPGSHRQRQELRGVGFARGCGANAGQRHRQGHTARAGLGHPALLPSLLPNPSLGGKLSLPGLSQSLLTPGKR